MDELLYETLNKYFRTLSVVGFKKDPVVFKMLVLQYIQEITTNEFRYFITNKDIKLMQDLLYQLFGSTCEISLPTNNRCCCMHICGDVPEYDNPQIENFMVAIPDGAFGKTQIKAATFDLINKRNVKADTLKIVYLNEGITVAEGLPIESPALILDHTVDIKKGVTYAWKASVIDTRGDEVKSNVFTYELQEGPVVIDPTITGFTLVPTNTNYVGAQSVTFTGANFTINKGTHIQEDSLKIYFGTEVLAEGLSVDLSSHTFSPAVTKALVVGQTYTAKASVLDTDGKEYFSNEMRITCSAIPITNPSISDFKLTPATTAYTGTQDVTFTGATFTLSKGNNFKENSLEIIWDTSEVMGTGLSTVGSSVTFASAIKKNLVEGTTYTARASVEDKNGTKYYSNTFSIRVNTPVVPIWMYSGNQAAKPTAAEVLTGTKYDYKASTQFQTPVMSLKTIWVWLPKTVTLVSMENVNMQGDFLYNTATGKDLLKHEDMTVDGVDGILHYLTTIASKNPYKTIVK